jgi:hypothetical protein
VKVIYAVAFALFPLAALAQDASPLSAGCQDDYYEATAVQCLDILTVEAILEKYGAVVVTDTDAGLAALFLADPENVPVGSIRARAESSTAEHAILKDDEIGAVPPVQDTIASQAVVPTLQLESGVEGADDIVTTGPTAQRSLVSAGDDGSTVE